MKSNDIHAVSDGKVHFALTKGHDNDRGTDCPACSAKGLQPCVSLPRNEVHLSRVRAMGAF